MTCGFTKRQKEMEKRKVHKMLLYFRQNHYPPVFGAEYQRRTFRDLQKHNLIRINSEGKIILTLSGEKAIAAGGIKYLRAIEFEEELAKEAPKLKREKKLLLSIILILVICLIFLLWKEDDFTISFLEHII